MGIFSDGRNNVDGETTDHDNDGRDEDDVDLEIPDYDEYDKDGGEDDEEILGPDYDDAADADYDGRDSPAPRAGRSRTQAPGMEHTDAPFRKAN
ncbi:hypothetical protein DENSPDRAFT_887212 [Dentipellis sp. KUC8613]|nr:hypothetical protein DENSPDRAFT_887212 [Dentipellis sp. KUC8613]